MTYEEYIAAQQAIIAQLVAQLLALLNPLRAGTLNPAAWVGMLAATYMQVYQARTKSAELAREFYDSERADKLPGEPRHPIYLASYRTDWFAEAMEPARRTFALPQASEESMAHVIALAIKETENGGRRTALRAVDTDPKVKGWARVEGGGESCAFCAMLISRGPVYVGEDGARNAGLKADDVSAVEIWKQYDKSGDDTKLMELMSRWHPNCDCKVVPVFDRARWPGRDRYLEAEQLWIEATRAHSGKEKLRAFRRFMEARPPSEQDSRTPRAA